MNIQDHEIFLSIAKDYSRFSKCQFTKVGAIAVNERKRIIASGVNGTLPGHPNCCDQHFKHREDHVPFTTENEIHAEMNMILDLAKSGTKFRELSIYLTISPCAECLKAILSLTDTSSINTMSVRSIIYSDKYHRTTDDELNRMIEKARKAGTTLISIEDLRNQS